MTVEGMFCRSAGSLTARLAARSITAPMPIEVMICASWTNCRVVLLREVVGARGHHRGGDMGEEGLEGGDVDLFLLYRKTKSITVLEGN